MRLTHLLVAASAFLFAHAPALRAQDVLETTGGKTYTGKVLSNDGASVEIETGEGARMKLPFEQLTPETQYRLKLAATPNDGKSLLALADWCVDAVLYDQAKANYRKALAADVTMTDEINTHVVAARTKAANEVLARAKKLQASNQPQEARRILSLLVQELPLEEASTEAAQMLAAETTQRKEDSLKTRAPRVKADAAKDGAPPPMRDNGEPFSDETRKLFQPVIDSYRKMLDANQDGLSKGNSAGIDNFEKALKESEKIRKAVDKLRPDGANSEEITEALNIADTKLEEAVVDARINLSDAYMIRSSYNQAAEAIQQGLAAYPKNERLRQAMNRVTSATAESSGGGWVVGGKVLR